jgi:release factor glutamine methyltransferase
MTLGNWLKMAAARLTHEGIASAPLEAQVLAAHVLSVERSYVLAHPEVSVPEPELEHFLDRRAKHEPLAYILGWREFFGRRFAVSPSVLIPRQETELLVEIALLRLPHYIPLRVLDIGTGSGAIAITLKLERPMWDVHAVDISASALMVARENATALRASVSFFHADLFPAAQSPYDLVVSNPPYVAADDPVGRDVTFEPSTALYASDGGFEMYRRLCKEAPKHLANSGEMWVEIGAGQEIRICEMFADEGWGFIGAQPDLAGIVRVLGFKRQG